jgi:hypothetical protein
VNYKRTKAWSGLIRIASMGFALKHFKLFGERLASSTQVKVEIVP